MINDVQVLTSEETGVYHYTNRSTLTYVCQEAPAPVTCTTMRVYTFANGEVRVERVTSECVSQLRGRA